MLFSLLFLAPHADRPMLAAANVFTDLNLGKLLGEDALRHLSLLATSDEIHARQAFFRELGGSDFMQDILRLKTQLTKLAQCNAARGDAKTRIETIFTTCTLIRYYCETCLWLDSLENISQNALIQNLRLGIQAKLPEIISVQEKLTRLQPAALESMSRFQMVYTLLNPITERMEADLSYSPAPSFKRDYAETLKEKARALGADGDLNTPRSGTRINTTLAEQVITALFPRETAEAEDFIREAEGVLDMQILNLRSELEFYLNIHELTERAQSRGIPVTSPTPAQNIGRYLRAKNAYDITLLLKEDQQIIPNDIDFTQDENAFFLTGANGGGKTTYLRTVAVNLIFALAGCPVFADSAEFYLFREIHTHFPADERFLASGRLVEEKKRIDEILSQITPDSFVFLNETFSSTDPHIAANLIFDAADKIRKKQAFLLFVTHFYEVLERGIPSLHPDMSESPDGTRTFKIVRGHGTKSAYAADILAAFGLTEEKLRARYGEDFMKISASSEDADHV